MKMGSKAETRTQINRERKAKRKWAQQIDKYAQSVQEPSSDQSNSEKLQGKTDTAARAIKSKENKQERNGLIEMTRAEQQIHNEKSNQSK